MKKIVSLMCIFFMIVCPNVCMAESIEDKTPISLENLTNEFTYIDKEISIIEDEFDDEITTLSGDIEANNTDDNKVEADCLIDKENSCIEDTSSIDPQMLKNYDSDIDEISEEIATELETNSTMMLLIDDGDDESESVDLVFDEYYSSEPSKVGRKIEEESISTNEIVIEHIQYVYSYDGKEQELLYFSDFNDLLEVSGDIRATLPGKYQAVISIKDKDLYEYIRYYDNKQKKWITTDEDITIDWEITKGVIYLNYEYDEEVGIRYQYTGEEIELDFGRYNDLLNISGDVKATLPGKYQATISIKDKELYEYFEYYDAKQEDYITTSEDVTIEWEIEKVVTIQKDMTEDTGYTYSYKEKVRTLDFEEYSDILDISGIIATLPGKYQAVISIKDKDLCEYIRYYDHKKRKWIITDEDITIDWKSQKER